MALPHVICARGRNRPRVRSSSRDQSVRLQSRGRLRSGITVFVTVRKGFGIGMAPSNHYRFDCISNFRCNNHGFSCEMHKVSYPFLWRRTTQFKSFFIVSPQTEKTLRTTETVSCASSKKIPSHAGQHHFIIQLNPTKKISVLETHVQWWSRNKRTNGGGGPLRRRQSNIYTAHPAAAESIRGLHPTNNLAVDTSPCNWSNVTIVVTR